MGGLERPQNYHENISQESTKHLTISDTLPSSLHSILVQEEDIKEKNNVTADQQYLEEKDKINEHSSLFFGHQKHHKHHKHHKHRKHHNKNAPLKEEIEIQKEKIKIAKEEIKLSNKKIEVSNENGTNVKEEEIKRSNKIKIT